MRDEEFDAAELRPAPLHLLKMAVGVGDIDELRRFRAARLKERGASWVYTRNHPRRTEEVLAGGSIYWVIRGQTYCLIDVDPALVATALRPWRPFQGWRYLSPADAPPDAPVGPGGIAAMPERMLAELRALGLI
jgi:hypothetical protein